MHSFHISLHQINPTVGDIEGNYRLIASGWRDAASQGADLAVFPEMALSGYQLQDFVRRPDLHRQLERAKAHLLDLSREVGCALIYGAPDLRDDGVYNTAFAIDRGQLLGQREKRFLPNHSVFDEVREFQPGELAGPVMIRGVRIGLLVCEDFWHEETIECTSETGAELLLALNGSPFHKGKHDLRLQAALSASRISECACIYLNMVGGQDEIVFDGASFVLNPGYKLVARLAEFAPDQKMITFTRDADDRLIATPVTLPPTFAGPEALYQAARLALQDYVRKSGFCDIVLGLSGGIDSALSAAIAVDAVGPAHVHALMMPSRYTSQASLDDANAICTMLGISQHVISIESLRLDVEQALSECWARTEPGLAEENIQARLRALLLMAYANKGDHMLLATGNKSELACGYTTLYGDLCGGYAVLKDLYKTEVFELARWRNAQADGPVMPDRVLTRPPSAELRDHQRDEDSLPPYPVLDKILALIIEEDCALEEICAQGFDSDLASTIIRMVQQSEYKRFQAPPGVKLSARAFGRDWRQPLANCFDPGQNLPDMKA
ncbi:MAG: NAD+ synthase [Pseudomonadota bacterium]